MPTLRRSRPIADSRDDVKAELRRLPALGLDPVTREERTNLLLDMLLGLAEQEA